ncbi:MAG: family 16 glycosylhydrolase [Mariniblastus sp.]
MLHPNINSFVSLLVLALAFLGQANFVSAQSVSITDGPSNVQPGNDYTVTVKSNYEKDGIVQVQLFDASWKRASEKWKEVDSGEQTTKLKLAVPADAVIGKDYFWQVLLYDRDWKKQKEVIVKDLKSKVPELPTKTPSALPKETTTEKKTVEPTSDASRSANWTPEGDWKIDWQDEFDGTGFPRNWYPFLGYTPTDFEERTEKGIRWSGATEDTAWMYTSKTGNHWLNGDGQLVMRIVAEKEKANANGIKVSAAYLMTGYPKKWDKSEPENVKWAGKFVSPADGPLYISARVKTNQIRGYSTWFAFWLFSETRAYNGNPVDGTEVDIVEIPKGKKDYINKCFNVANHWSQNGKGSESLQLNSGTKPTASSLVDVNDDQYHVYGVEWTKTSMMCYVDGQLYYTFTENIPSDPVDMMMLLTLEFKKNMWDPDQGDGRSEGPSVSDNEKIREMSRVLVDYVRVYKKQ